MKLSLAAILSTAALVTALTRLIPGDWCGELVQFRVAGELLASGQSPYRSELQFSRQVALREGEAPRLIPYHNVPWLALACAPFSLVSLAVGKVIWCFLGSLALVTSAWLMTGVAPGLSRPAMVVLCVTFPLSLFANWMGQVSPLVLLLTVCYWRFTETGFDHLAGSMLALTTIKPQLVVLLIPVVLLWSARTGRWGIVVGFVATAAALCLVSFAFLPGWPSEFLWALRTIPMTSETRPEIAVVWWTVLRAAGLSGWPLVAAYAAVAVPMALLVALSAWRARRPLFDLLAWGLLAAFFVAPYAQIYDFPVLLPAFFAALRRSAPVVAMISVFTMIFGLYTNFVAVAGWGIAPGSMFWFPASLAIALVASAFRDEQNRSPQEGK
jgi:Glycosyltransferase family 87